MIIFNRVTLSDNPFPEKLALLMTHSSDPLTVLNSPALVLNQATDALLERDDHPITRSRA